MQSGRTQEGEKKVFFGFHNSPVSKKRKERGLKGAEHGGIGGGGKGSRNRHGKLVRVAQLPGRRGELMLVVRSSMGGEGGRGGAGPLQGD